MRRRFAAWFILFFVVSSCVSALAKSDQVQKMVWDMSGLSFSWIGGDPDDYGTPEHNSLNISREDPASELYMLTLDREYLEDGNYIGHYSFRAPLPAGVFDVAKSLGQTVHLNLTLDGMGTFYPSGNELQPRDDGEEPPEDEEPVPSPETRTFVIDAEPTEAIRSMMNSTYRSDVLKVNEKLVEKLNSISVTGSLDGIPFESADGSLSLRVWTTLIIGEQEEEPLPEAAVSGEKKENSSGSRPLADKFEQISLGAMADEFITEEDYGYTQSTYVNFNLDGDLLHVNMDFNTFDPDGMKYVYEHFYGSVYGFMWDPSALDDGVFKIDVTVDGALERMVFGGEKEESDVETSEVTRHIVVTFDLLPEGVSRSISKMTAEDYSTKEKRSGIQYVGPTTISINESAPLPGTGTASLTTSTFRTFGEITDMR